MQVLNPRHVLDKAIEFNFNICVVVKVDKQRRVQYRGNRDDPAFTMKHSVTVIRSANLHTEIPSLTGTNCEGGRQENFCLATVEKLNANQRKERRLCAMYLLIFDHNESNGLLKINTDEN